MQQYQKTNKSFRYILVYVNCFSKLIDAVALKSKNQHDVLEGFITIYDRAKYKVKNLQSDNGNKNFFYE